MRLGLCLEGKGVDLILLPVATVVATADERNVRHWCPRARAAWTRKPTAERRTMTWLRWAGPGTMHVTSSAVQ